MLLLAAVARPLRVHVSGGRDHVAGRGLERRAIFTQNRDREHFYELLSLLRERDMIRAHRCFLVWNRLHFAPVNETIQPRQSSRQGGDRETNLEPSGREEQVQ